MDEIYYKAKYYDLLSKHFDLGEEHFVAEENRKKANGELRRRLGQVEIVALVLFVAGLGSMAGAIFLGWPLWIPVAFMWSGWSCLTTADYIGGAVTRTVFI